MQQLIARPCLSIAAMAVAAWMVTGSLVGAGLIMLETARGSVGQTTLTVAADGDLALGSTAATTLGEGVSRGLD